MGGLALLPDAAAIARVVREATGDAPGEVRPLARGATCMAWQAEAGRARVAVIVEVPPAARAEAHRDTPANLAVRHAVLTALGAADVPGAPGAFACSATTNRDPLDGRWAWQVTSLAPEAVLDPDDRDTVRRLGAFLAALHAITVTGFGLLEDRADVIHGRAPDADAGIASRWPRAWPYTGEPLIAHPLARLAPALLTEVGALRDPLLRLASIPPRLCHTDLHPGHLRVDAAGAPCVIDFGDAAIVPPAFDLASFAYFAVEHGWREAPLQALLEGYAPNRILRETREAETHAALVVTALRMIEKHARASDDAGARRALAVLRAALPLAHRREA